MRKFIYRKQLLKLVIVFACYLSVRKIVNSPSSQNQTLTSEPRFESEKLGQTKFIDLEATTHGGRGDESINGDGDELSRLQKRDGKEYSEGHRRIYGSIVTLIGGTDTFGRARILEVGTGIGYGLNLMLNDVQISTYVGIEPCTKCLDYVKKKVVDTWIRSQKNIKAGLSKKKQALFSFPKIHFRNGVLENFSKEDILSSLEGQADFTLCIEVAEHVQPNQRLHFFTSLKELTKGTLFLSTPNKDNRPKDGALSIGQWSELMSDAGFIQVIAIEWQWTTLFICQ